jgi:hypothetical protein
MPDGAAEPLRVFISYRPEDSIGIAGRIRDRLVLELGPDNVIFDIDTVPPEVDLPRHIDNMVASCDLVLVIIGRRWDSAAGEDGERRLYLEVDAAQRHYVRVVPVLVDGATMPEPSHAPTSILGGTPFSVRNDPDFQTDVDGILDFLGVVSLSSASAQQVPQPEPLEPREPIATMPAGLVQAEATATAVSGNRAAAEPDGGLVFLSYASEDRSRVIALVEMLRGDGIRLFWDRRTPPGKNAMQYLGAKLAESRCVVVVWTSSSVASKYVINEAIHGFDRDRLVPVRLDDVVPPFPFSNVQAADLSTWDGVTRSEDVDGFVDAVRDCVQAE